MRIRLHLGKMHVMTGGESVLIVDDHAGFRSMARRLLEASGFVVAGEADTGDGAILATRALAPDVVLLDIKLPDLDGFEVARRLAAIEHGPTVVFVSSREACDYGDRVTSSDAAGFVPKDELSGTRLRTALEGA
jgi:DNA-binding NarL/FixJ family response regulator